jgi:hypothetical protein
VSIVLIHIIVLFLVHYVADFIFQTRKVADNKGKNVLYLLLHGFHYTLVWLGILSLIGLVGVIIGTPLLSGSVTWCSVICFSLLNGLLHTITDFITSKFTSRFYARKNFSAFFNVIGFDQFVHATTIILTYNWLLT